MPHPLNRSYLEIAPMTEEELGLILEITLCYAFGQLKEGVALFQRHEELALARSIPVYPHQTSERIH